MNANRETFWRSTRASVGLVAAMVTLATMMGVGFVLDHLWLVGQRNLLKSATDAASVAATLQLRSFPKTVDDATAEAALQQTVQRYIALNVAHMLSAAELRKLAVTVEMDRPLGTVDVRAEAPLGGTLFGAIHGYLGLSVMQARSGADYDWVPVWAVLAIDVSRTMNNALDGSYGVPLADQRITIVRAAAKEFISAVGPDPDIPIAIGLVPWASAAWGVLAPSTTAATIETALDGLTAVGSATASSRGLRRSRELLEPAPPGARRIIVLLTDGEDNQSVHGGSCGPRGRADCPQYRKAECDGAKIDGVEIFVIAAMSNTSGALADQLRECASHEANAFINHADAETMRATFGTIGGVVKEVRRSY